MIVRVLVLEDVESWGKQLCENLESLDSDFFKNIDTEITKIETKLVTNTKDALKVLVKETIDLISIDIKLNESTEGHDFYEQMFLKGIDKPSIVVSGEVDTPGIRESIVGKGIPIIVRKLKDGSIHVRVANAICEVLNSQRKLALQIETYVTYFDLWDYNLEHNGTKPITKWIDMLISQSLETNDRIEIRKKIIDKCIEQSKYEQRSM